MAVSTKDVQRIAHLARFNVKADELASYQKDLSNILELIEPIKQIDTSKVTPMEHPLHAIQRQREDEVNEPNQRELLLKNAPKTAAGVFLVPQVLPTSDQNSDN